MAPPMQVAAPPNGSISVGWLCVSFLNRYSPVSYTHLFRGTDTSITGWRENFNMCYTAPVPAQELSLIHI